MVVNQIHALVNSVSKQAWGENAITVADLTGLIAMGNKILNSSTDKDAFLNALCDRIGKTIIQQRAYSAKRKKMLLDSITYGAAVMKTYVEPEDALSNGSWSVAEGQPLGPGNIHLPTVKVKIFENHDTWAYEVCIPDYQINTAFTGESEVASFVSSIYTAIDTSMNVALESMENMCIANFMAEKIHWQAQPGTTGVHAVNVLDKYNKATGHSLTASACLLDADFLRYAGAYIKKTIDKFSSISQIFNKDGYKRYTPSDRLNILFLSEYAAANETYLQSNTFNQELVKLPGYDTITFWQGLGASGDFADTSKINVTTSSGDTVEQSGIIGFVYDTDALGVMFDQLRTTSYVDPAKDLTKIWNKATMGYFNDLSENACVFYVANV